MIHFFSFRKKQITGLMVTLSSLLFFTPATFASFTDVPQTHPFYNAINVLEEKGVIKGYADGSFQPEKTINKAEFTTLVFRDAGYQPPVNLYETGFNDVPSDSWFAPFVKKLLEMKITIVDPQFPYFFPTTNTTRLDAYQLLYPLKGIPSPLILSQEKTIFTDINSADPWYYLAHAAAKSGIYVPSQENVFGAYRTLTRGEAAYLIYKADNYKGNEINLQDISGLDEDLLKGLENINETEYQLLHHPKFPLLLQVWNKINSQYVNKNDLDQTRLIYGAIHGMVESLGDAYSVFLDPENAGPLSQFLSGSYEGVGLLIDQFEGNFIIVNVIKDSPADKAGIQPGDYITKINSESVIGYSLEEVLLLMKGESGTTIDLTVKHDTTTKTYHLIRAEILEKTVAYPASPVTIPDDIAYIAIYQFIDSTGDEFKEALDAVMAKKPKGLVLDLRNNPGGYVNTAYEVLEQFISKDKILTQIKTPEKTIKELSKAESVIDTKNLPIIVLVNENTASAGEIVAGALQDYKLAKLLGETTFGKGTVQEVSMYEDGALFKLTIAQWLTPLGNSINGKGLTPDIAVTKTKDDILGNTDSQLTRAIKELGK